MKAKINSAQKATDFRFIKSSFFTCKALVS